MMAFTGDWLKTKQRTVRDNFSENLGLRVHRAISWIKRRSRKMIPMGASSFSGSLLMRATPNTVRNRSTDPREENLTHFFRRLVSLTQSP